MELYQLKPIHKLKKSKRIGRGGKRGTFSGRGIKGQNSRAGRKFQPIARELIKRYPKLRGYRQKTQQESQGLRSFALNLELLEKNYQAGEKVNAKSLVVKGLVPKSAGLSFKAKILARGDIKKSLIFEGVLLSKSAKEKIEKAGGQVC
jgi:large subunit ribosomal protein L15